MAEPSAHHHAGVNASKIVDCHHDKRFAEIIEQADIVNPDGMSVVWASRLLGSPLPERVTGVDIMPAMLESAIAHGWGVYLLGARSEVVADVASLLPKSFPGLRLCGYRDGYWGEADVDDVVAAVRESGADLLFLGLPSPAKEYFYDNHHHSLGVRMVVGVGGTFDVMAGRVRRAPILVQKLGLEWVYRLVQEPRRLWRRYLFGNVSFATSVYRQRSTSRADQSNR